MAEQLRSGGGSGTTSDSDTDSTSDTSSSTDSGTDSTTSDGTVSTTSSGPVMEGGGQTRSTTDGTTDSSTDSSGGSGSSSTGSTDGSTSTSDSGSTETTSSSGPQMEGPGGQTETGSTTGDSGTSTSNTGSTATTGTSDPTTTTTATGAPVATGAGESRDMMADSGETSDADATGSSTGNSRAESQSRSRSPEQGLEDYEPGVDPNVRDAASDLEQEYIENTPGIDDPSQVRIVWDDKESGTIRTELTAAGERELVERQVKEQTGLPEESFNVTRTEDGSFDVELVEQEDPTPQNPSTGSGGVRDMPAADDDLAPVSRPGAGVDETRAAPGDSGETVMTGANDEPLVPLSRPGSGEDDTQRAPGDGGEQEMTAADAETVPAREADGEFGTVSATGLDVESGETEQVSVEETAERESKVDRRTARDDEDTTPSLYEAADLDTAKENPIKWLRGAGPQREEDFINALTGGLQNRGESLQQDLHDAEPGYSDVSQDQVGAAIQSRIFGRDTPYRPEDIPSSIQSRASNNREELATAAAVGVAAPEPASTTVGVAILGGLAAVSVVSESELEPEEQRTSEIETPEDPTQQSSELDPVEQRTSELDAPAEPGRASEMPAPEDPSASRSEIDVGEEGDIQSSIDATSVATQQRYDEEEEEEEEDEDTEEEEDPIVDVPDEMVPEETVLIGEVGTAEDAGTEEEADEETEGEEAQDQVTTNVGRFAGAGEAREDSLSSDEEFAEETGTADGPVSTEQVEQTDLMSETDTGNAGAGGDVPGMTVTAVDEERERAEETSVDQSGVSVTEFDREGVEEPGIQFESEVEEETATGAEVTALGAESEGLAGVEVTSEPLSRTVAAESTEVSESTAEATATTTFADSASMAGQAQGSATAVASAQANALALTNAAAADSALELGQMLNFQQQTRPERPTANVTENLTTSNNRRSRSRPDFGGPSVLPFDEEGRTAPESESDEFLAPGWFAETVTTIATTGRTDGDAPQQDRLEDLADGEWRAGELPTEEMLSGDEETQEQIEETQALLGGFGSGVSFDFGL